MQLWSGTNYNSPEQCNTERFSLREGKLMFEEMENTTQQANKESIYFALSKTNHVKQLTHHKSTTDDPRELITPT
jgi:hypothetical protein